MTLRLNAILANAPGCEALTGTCRIIGVAKDGIFLIDLPREDPKRPNRMLDYLGAPRWVEASTIDALFRESKILVFEPERSVASLPDVDALALTTDIKERQRLEREFAYRDKRYNALLPLLRDGEDERRMYSATELLCSESLPEKVRACAKQTGRSLPTIYNLLHLYWAGGSQKSALMPGFRRCGNPGMDKVQKNPLGRRSRLNVSGITSHRCLVLDKGMGRADEFDTVSDKQKLAWGWRLIRHGCTRTDAFLTVSGMFWADHRIDTSGAVKPTLWDVHRRPTFAQFCYWGPRLNQGLSATEAVLGRQKWRIRTETRGGSEQDLVSSVGQVASFDGTKTDVYLVSMHSRLKKLPPMLRLVIKDLRADVICGWYLGWESASPKTAIQAIYHAASSKAEECGRLGLAGAEDAIPVILHRTYLADNGELKAEAVTEFEQQFGIGIYFTPTGRGDKKGGIESQHHADHKKLDHKLPGSTNGKQRERGTEHPALNALFNSYEYRREWVQHVVDHNTQEVPDLAPVEMGILNPEILPTRINIFNWLRRRQSAEAPVDEAAMRAFALPDVEAVVRKNGIYPLVEILGSKLVVPRLRFTSDELLSTGLLSQVKRTGITQRTRIKMDSSNPDRAWLPTKAGLIPLACAARSESIRRKLTFADWISSYEDRLIARDLRLGERQQAKLDTLDRRKTVEINAKAEIKQEIKMMGRRPGKAEQVRNLDRNLAEEIAHSSPVQPGGGPMDLRQSSTRVPPPDLKDHSSAKLPSPVDGGTDVADSTMDSLNDEEF